MSLGEFLRHRATESAPWNCSTLPADWCVHLGHPDFAAAWRGIVDRVDGEDCTAAAGGLVNLWERGLSGALPEVLDDLSPGDVAVVRVFNFEAGAIWTGQRWALKTKHGLHFAAADQVELIMAWRP